MVSERMWYRVIILKVLCQQLGASLLDFLWLTILCYHSPSFLHNSSVGKSLFPNQCIVAQSTTVLSYVIFIVTAGYDQVTCKDSLKTRGELMTPGTVKLGKT